MEAQIALLKQDKKEQAERELEQNVNLNQSMDHGWFEYVCDGLIVNGYLPFDVTSPSPLSSTVSRVDAHSENGSSGMEESEGTKGKPKEKRKAGNAAYKDLYRKDWWQVESRVANLLDKA